MRLHFYSGVESDSGVDHEVGILRQKDVNTFWHLPIDARENCAMLEACPHRTEKECDPPTHRRDKSAIAFSTTKTPVRVFFDNLNWSFVISLWSVVKMQAAGEGCRENVQCQMPNSQ